MATERYAGHDSGTECVNDGRGNFTYRQLAPAELLARAPAAKIQDDIFRHANNAGVCYYEIFKLIAEAIQEGIDGVRTVGAYRNKHYPDELMTPFMFEQLKPEDREKFEPLYADGVRANSETSSEGGNSDVERMG